MSERDDGYLGFAAHYDLHGWDWFARVFGARLGEVLDREGLKRARVLDAGCGTGTLALALASAGHHVTGLDLSEAMLAVARRKDNAGSVTWRRGDVTDFDLNDAGSPFDLITCVADILNHLETLEMWLAAFERFHAHLRPGGLLLFDIMTTSGLSRLDKQGVEETDGRTLIFSMVFEPRTRRSTVKATSFIPTADDHLYEKATETIPEWGQPVDGIFDRLGRAGFIGPERLWSAGGDPELEDRLIVLAARR